MKKPNKLLLGLGLAGTMAITTIGGSLAYLTDTSTTVNSTLVGKVDVEALPNEDLTHLVPGANKLNQEIILKDGSEPCFVRATVTIKNGKILEDYMRAYQNMAPKDQSWWLDKMFTISDSWRKDISHSNHNDYAQAQAGENDVVYTYYYYNGGSNTPVDALDGDKNLGAVYTRFNIPEEFNHEEMNAAFQDLSIEYKIDAIQAGGNITRDGLFGKLQMWIKHYDQEEAN